MGSCEVWDVVRLPFPYTNRSVHQYRPALVIAISNGTGTLRLLWVLMITSAENRGCPGDVEIADLAGVGLSAASVVRTAKIATVEMDMAERIGRLALPDRRCVMDAVRDRLAVAGICAVNTA
jgi:mRNA interferase MazF